GINEDDGSPCKFRGGFISTVCLFPASQFFCFAGREAVACGFWNLQVPDDGIVERTYAPARDRTHCQLLVAGDSRLAHDEAIPQQIERPGQFVGDRDPAARQCEHKSIPSILELLESSGEDLSGFGSIVKTHTGYPGVAFSFRLPHSL